MTDQGRNDPQVTVVIAAWNAEETIIRAIDSALSQTVPVEVIVVDDRSTDNTPTLAENRAKDDPRLTVLCQPENAGPSAARNRAIAAGRAPWIAILDSDDWMEPDRLARLLDLAARHGADFMADDLWKLDVGAPEATRRPMLGDVTGMIPVTSAEFVASNLSAGHGGRREMGFVKPLMSRSFLDRHGLNYDPNIRLGEDYVIYMQALLEGAVFLLTGPTGYVATVRPNSLSGHHPTEAHAHLVAADRALLARKDLSADTRRALEAHMMEQYKKWAWRKLIDAVRAADPVAALRCFWAPPQVTVDLFGRLIREAVVRARRRTGAG